MSVHKKLNEARIKLQAMSLEKSGHNKFAGYKYFELGDFMPAINTIFSEVGLCGVVSYGAELATLTIYDTDQQGEVSITSPMAEANLKGCHPIQNLGAVETYTRRYLWVTAMEIVEHDALDSSEPIKEVKKIPELKSIQLSDFSDEEQTFLKDTAMEIIAFVAEGNELEAFNKTVNLDNDEKLALWTLLDSKSRASLKKSSQTQQLKAA
ncbi:MAG: ERF family protein [Pseudomonadota bacterium]